MLYQTLSLFEGSKITAGIDAKHFGGKGNKGKAADSLISVKEFAAYAYMQQDFFKKFSLSAGLRIENNSMAGNELIPMIGVNYYPNPETVIKSSVSKGFRSPTIMEMFLFAPNPELKSEKLWNYEIGWLQQFINGRLNTEITVFLAEAKNVIQKKGTYPKLSRENVGEFTNKGVELSVNYKARKNLFLHLNYSYLNLSKILLAAPEHQINFSANYKYKIINAHIALQHINNLYTLINRDKKQTYTLLNLRISANIYKYLNVFVAANNILNETYEINYGYTMPKTNYSVGINFRIK